MCYYLFSSRNFGIILLLLRTRNNKLLLCHYQLTITRRHYVNYQTVNSQHVTKIWILFYLIKNFIFNIKKHFHSCTSTLSGTFDIANQRLTLSLAIDFFFFFVKISFIWWVAKFYQNCREVIAKFHSL